MGSGATSEARVKVRVESLRAELEALRHELAERDAAAARLEEQLARETAARSRLAEERDTALRDYALMKRDHEVLLRSRSYRMLEPLRRWYGRHPRASRLLLRCWTAGRWALALEFSKIVDAVRHRRRLRQEIGLLQSSGLFDAAHYVAANPDIHNLPMSPIEHYVSVGGREGRSPNPLFDGAWYLRSNPDVAATGRNPLVHFVNYGARELRDPNPYFDVRYYRQTNPDFEACGLDPITHYVRIGSVRLAGTSPNFDRDWYLEQNPDVAQDGIDPLLHFLRSGRFEGRLPKLGANASFVCRPVTDAAIECLKPPRIGRELALVVTHSPDGRLKPHLRWYLEALAGQQIGVILIVAADRPFQAAPDWLDALVSGLFVRANEGYDFAAWAHVLRLHREIYRADTLYLTNDSLLGPTNVEAFGAVVRRMREHEADIVGLTDNHERGWHVQSYFLMLKSRVLVAYEFHRFILDIVAFADKDAVIDKYEVKFTPAMRTAGLQVGHIFSAPTRSNPTVYHWRDLLESGFPFLKVMTVRDTIRDVDKSGWREELAGRGYDVALADRLLTGLAAAKTVGASTPVAVRPSLVARRPRRVEFIGPWGFDNGLGVAARGYIRALMHAGLEVNVLPIRRPFHVHRRVAPTVEMRNFVGPADVAVVHVNPESWSPLLDDAANVAAERAAAMIGAYVWESKTLPDYVVSGVQRVSAVWAPSGFCAEAFRPFATGPVDVVPYVVPIRPSAPNVTRLRALRQELALADGERVILYAFDTSSYLVRKNPAALVTAFAGAGLAARGWRLVLKTKHLDERRSDAASLVAQVRATDGVSILNRSMDVAELDTLMDLSDIYASTHCSEGFGLSIAEAMAKGKLVVASDYGGSQEFLDNTCGFPVRCSEWALDEDQGAYNRGTVWGRVDPDHLAESLLAAAEARGATREALARNARRRVAEHLSPQAVGDAMRASIERLLDESVSPARRVA